MSNLSADFRIGIDVMTTETTCLSSIWKTDDIIREFYEIHGRTEEYKELNPGQVAYYDGMIEVDLDQVKPMIAMPFHPSNTYTIEELNANLMDILDDCEKKAQVSLDGAVEFTLKDKVKTEGSMSIRALLRAAQAAVLRISAMRQTSLKEPALVRMNLL